MFQFERFSVISVVDFDLTGQNNFTGIRVSRHILF